MSLQLSIYTIGGGDLLEEVFNAIASVFNSTGGIGSLTSLAVMLGGMFAVFEFSRTRDVSKLIRWMGVYVLVTSLMLYPKATVHIEDRSGIDIKPRAIDHVPLSLAIFASFTSELGIAMTEMIETVFHLPNDLNYNKTGMLMGSKLVTAAKNFQITDPEFSQTLNEFMQQCVFFDLLLQKYTVKDLTHAQNPWEFIKANTSVARAFPLNGEITICKSGAAKLDKIWKDEINNAASIYGGQIMGGGRQVGITLLSRLSDGYGFLTKVSTDGEALLKTNLVANAMSQALTHYGANSNAPAALQAYLDTKTELQTRQALGQTGMQAGIWMQEFTNILQALVYSLFIIVYFLSYFPFGFVIIRNYLMGMFILQSFAPMYAIINFAATFYAQGRSMAFIAADTTHSTLSISNVIGVAQANVDAMAIAGYLMWPVTIGGAIMLWRGMPGAIQSMGHYVGGVAQSAATHIAAEAVGGNISVGNSNFGNHSLSNTTANHFDTNARFAAGMATWQTGTGANVSITPSGSEVMDTRGSMSNLGASVQIADSIRSAMSKQAQTSHNAALNQSKAAGEQYSAGLRQVDDYGSHQSHFVSSGKSHTMTDSTGLNKSAHEVFNMVETFRKEHHISHERAAQVLASVYADAKVGVGFIAKGEVGISGSSSVSGRSAFGSLYNDDKQYAVDHNFSETVDSANRAAVESHYRDSTDQGSRYADSIASSFDRGDTFRNEAASSYSKSSNFAALASQSQDNASSVTGNYTQEFYEWMRTQSSPYGNGTMSKSAIDNMAAHDPSLLQNYANHFVEQKTNEINQEFSHAHHLDQGGAQVKHDYQVYNQSVGGQSHVNNQYEHYQEEVNSHKNAEPGSLGSIDSSIATKTQQQMSHDNEHLEKSRQAVQTQSESLKENVKEKVKGQVIGSLMASDQKVSDAVNQGSAVTGYIPLGAGDVK
jgi:conjugal transfer mating pair stabilization protein TraG